MVYQIRKGYLRTTLAHEDLHSVTVMLAGGHQPYLQPLLLSPDFTAIHPS